LFKIVVQNFVSNQSVYSFPTTRLYEVTTSSI